MIDYERVLKIKGYVADAKVAIDQLEAIGTKPFGDGDVNVELDQAIITLREAAKHLQAGAAVAAQKMAKGKMAGT